MASGAPKDMPLKWYEVDKVENETFPTDREYHIIIQREAIPIIFVPGIMGSRLYCPSRKGKLIWDPDDPAVMTDNFLTRGGLGQKGPQERLQVIVGDSFNPNYLQVAGTDDGKTLTKDGKHADAMRKFVVQETSDYWDWARRDQRVSENASYDHVQYSAAGKESYTRSQLGHLPWERDANPETNESMGTYSHKLYEADLAVYNGWGGISWSFYGEIMLRLAGERWEEFAKCFYFPVYGFGYNWSASNETSGAKLNDYIDKIIPNERTREGKNNICNYVIVVTHSMGGLVARWASEKAGAKSKILGIVHGAQPVVGTPAAYHQFRAGEDVESFWGPLLKREAPTAWGTSHVIGSDASHIDPIFGHCPGPFQLLPSGDYHTNTTNREHPSSASWLFQKDEHGKIIAQLPNGDPYETIYRNFGSFLGFGEQSKNVLGEGKDPDQGGGVKGTGRGNKRSGSEVLLENVREASQFHGVLHTLCHPNTFYGYGIDLAGKTYDEISYSWKRNFVPTETYATSEGAVTVTDPGDSSLGQGVDFDKSRNAYFKIDPKAASGDGTVAASSSTALGAPGGRSHDSAQTYPEMPHFKNDSVIRALAVKNVEHSDYYKRDESLAFTVNAVRELAQNYLCRKIGRAQKLAQLPLPPF